MSEQQPFKKSLSKNERCPNCNSINDMIISEFEWKHLIKVCPKETSSLQEIVNFLIKEKKYCNTCSIILAKMISFKYGFIIDYNIPKRNKEIWNNLEIVLGDN